MYPSTISTFTNPSPTDRLSTTPHSAIETAQNTDLTAIETFVGTLSSTQGTLVYDIRSSNSNGGGHVQTANLGGTGQTTFNKGDVLVGQSSSVLTKLAVGTDGLVLTADSNQATGVSWKGVATATDIQNETFTYARASVMSASVYGINLSQAVSVLSDGLGVVVKWPTTNTVSPMALSINATGPSSVAALIKDTSLNDVAVGAIRASMISVLKFDSVSSVFQIMNPAPPSSANGTVTFSASSVASISVPFAAKSIRINAVSNVSGVTASRFGWSNGGYDGGTGTSKCVFLSHDNNGDTATSGIDSSNAWSISSGTTGPGTNAGFVSSVSGTGFSLVNVKTGTTDNALLYWEAL